MVDKTARDRAWAAILEALLDGRELRIKDVAEEADVSRDTARGALLAAKDEEFVTRESDESHYFAPNIDVIALLGVTDWEYQREIRTIVEEAHEVQSEREQE